MGALPVGCDLTTSAPMDGSTLGLIPSVLQVYPSPVRGELHLRFAPGGEEAACDQSLALTIVDPAGRKVFEGELKAEALHAGGATLDLRGQMRHWAAGVYFGRIVDCRGEPRAFRFTLVK